MKAGAPNQVGRPLAAAVTFAVTVSAGKSASRYAVLAVDELATIDWFGEVHLLFVPVHSRPVGSYRQDYTFFWAPIFQYSVSWQGESDELLYPGLPSILAPSLTACYCTCWWYGQRPYGSDSFKPSFKGAGSFSCLLWWFLRALFQLAVPMEMLASAFAQYQAVESAAVRRLCFVVKSLSSSQICYFCTFLLLYVGRLSSTRRLTGSSPRPPGLIMPPSRSSLTARLLPARTQVFKHVYLRFLALCSSCGFPPRWTVHLLFSKLLNLFVAVSIMVVAYTR